MNTCIFTGRFTADPEKRYSSNGEMAICRFRLAVPRRFKRDGEPDADFLNMVSFGKTAENIEKYFEKGSMILVQTHVQTGSYEKDGRKAYTTDFVVDAFDFIGGKAEGKETKPASKEGEFVPVPEGDGELPW